MKFSERIRRRLLTASEYVFPIGLFRPGLRLQPTREVFIKQLPPSDSDIAEMTSAASDGVPFDAILSRETALRREVTIPRSASRQAENAISMQMRHSMPQQARGLVWQGERLGATAGSAIYAVYVLKKELLADLMRSTGPHRGLLRTLRFAEMPGPPLIDERVKLNLAGRRWSWITATISSLAILSTIVLTEVRAGALRADNRALADQLSALETSALEARQAAQQGEETTDKIRTAAAAFDEEVHRLAVIAALTRILPDTAWVSELSIRGTQLRLSGFVGGDVASLVAVLQDEPWAVSVKLDGPIIFDSYSQKNRFELLAELNSGGS